MKLLTTLAIVGTTISQALFAQSEVKDKIDLVFEEVSAAGNFNGNVLISQKEEIVYQNSFGYVGGSKSEDLSKNHKFNLGSIFKEFPAICLIKLHEEDKLNLDSKLSSYITDLPSWSTEISLLNLLQYSAGLPRIAWGKHPIINDASLMQELKSLETLESTPGSTYLYSNYSPFLITKVIEKVTGESFISYCERVIFEPAGMNQTVFKDKLPYGDLSNMAIPFNRDFENEKLPFSIEFPAFLLSSTISDMNKYLLSLHKEKLISRASIAIISKPFNGNDEFQAPLGNVRLVDNKVLVHQHHGSSGNYESLVIRNIEKGLNIILMTNQKNNNLFDLAEKVEKLF